MKVLSDHDLDTLIAERLGIKPIKRSAIWAEGSIPDYCNSWDDLIPLVIEYGLFESATIMATVSLSDNPQRALAETLLKVLKEMNK